VNIPTRTAMLVFLIVMALGLAACGGGGGGGGGNGGGDDGAEEFPDRAEATSEDAEGTTYALREGRYRLSYRAPGCQGVVIRIASVDGAFEYEQQQRVPTSFVNDVLAGEYEIAVVSDCDEWRINLNEF
jgi:hypothetical protein